MIAVVKPYGDGTDDERTDDTGVNCPIGVTGENDKRLRGGCHDQETGDAGECRGSLVTFCQADAQADGQ